ncbi:UNVERIFIED_CONTAM: hypothetical protein HDU68_006495 [Siphonaria sp. JEL0065]|nr:hypothetical protein HDU68_006495 [Siphonaria sp. JEL0065]
MKVPGYDALKQKRLYEAFVDAAEEKRVIEALEYYNLFLELPNKIEVATTCPEKIKEIRLLIQLHFEKREYAKCIAISREGLKILGCKKSIHSPRAFTMLYNIIRLSYRAKKIISSDQTTILKELRKFYKETYPNAQQIQPKSNAVSDESLAGDDQENEMISEIREILYKTVSAHQHYHPGPEVFQLILIDMIAPLKRGITEMRIATYCSALAIGSAFMGFLKLSTLASRKADVFLAEMEALADVEQNMNQSQAEDYTIILESSSYTHQLYGHHAYAAACQIKAYAILVAYGQGYSEKAFYIARNRQHSLYYTAD